MNKDFVLYKDFEFTFVFVLAKGMTLTVIAKSLSAAYDKVWVLTGLDQTAIKNLEEVEKQYQEL